MPGPSAKFARYLLEQGARSRKGAGTTLKRVARRLRATEGATRALLNPTRRRHCRSLLLAVEREVGIPVRAWRKGAR